MINSINSYLDLHFSVTLLLTEKCVEVLFNDGQSERNLKDHVCLTETSTCIYHGTFLHEIASTVVVTKDCPLHDSGIFEISFQCDRVKGMYVKQDVT